MTTERAARRGVCTALAGVVALVSGIAGPVAPSTGSAVAAEPSVDAPGAFVPVVPCRLTDTRLTDGRLAPDSALDVIAHRTCGVSETAIAVSVTITAVDPDDRGFLTAWPVGFDRPLAASLNYSAGANIGNHQLVRLGEDGAFSIYSRAAVDVTVDVSGYFEAVTEPVAEGRFVPVAPTRLLDSRETQRPAPQSSVVASADVPDDAIAVAISVATTDVSGPAFFSAYPAGGDRPHASILNVDRAGRTRQATTIVPVVDGEFEVYTHGGDHVIVDLSGYFTGPSAEPSFDGLFVPIVPTRVLDTRLAWDEPGGGPRLWDHGTRFVDVAGAVGSAAAAVAANVTVTATEDRGYASVWPATTAQPLVSSVNYDTAQMTIASSALVGVSGSGLAMYAHEAAHAIVDISGWFTGDPVESGPLQAVNEPPVDRRVTIIGDSAFAGMRWNATLAGLQGMELDHRLESCRRLVVGSCRGREGYRPYTARNDILRIAAGPEDLLVITTGYNDWHGRFESDFETIVATARSVGFRHIAWVTYRSNVGYTLPGGGGRSNYGEMNRILADKVASGDYPEVRIWDYDAYTAGAAGWFYSDGVHERTIGSWGTADFLSRQVAAFDDKPCPQPWAFGEAADDPCPSPVIELGERGSLPDIAGVYGLG